MSHGDFPVYRVQATPQGAILSPAQKAENCPHCGQKWVEPGRFVPGSFSCFSFVGCQSPHKAVQSPPKSPRWTLARTACKKRTQRPTGADTAERVEPPRVGRLQRLRELLSWLVPSTSAFPSVLVQSSPAGSETPPAILPFRTASSWRMHCLCAESSRTDPRCYPASPSR